MEVLYAMVGVFLFFFALFLSDMWEWVEANVRWRKTLRARQAAAAAGRVIHIKVTR